MKNKGLIAFFTALSLAATLSLPVLGADAPSDWAKAEVESAISQGLVPREMQSSYQTPITRQEFCRLAVTMSERYITDRFLPDKAIDLVDEACAMIRTEIDSMPAELDDLRRKIMQQEIEEMALKKEDDQLSRDRLEELKKELADEKEQFNAMKSRWEAEKSGVDSVKQLKSQIEQMNGEIERAQANLEYEKAAKLKYSDLPV